MFIISISLPLYAQIENTSYNGCDYITTHNYIESDTFFLGQKYPNPSPASYEAFGVPEQSLVKFKIFSSVNSDLVMETEYCSLARGGFHFDWGNMPGIIDIPSGVYLLEMSAFSKDYKVKFKEQKRILIVK
jgi:hypothetical protein